MVPHSDIDESHGMQSSRSVKVILYCYASAISRLTQRRRMIVNGTAGGFQIYALAILFMGKHESTGNEWMRRGQVPFGCFALLKSHQVSLAAQRTTVTRNRGLCWDCLHQNDVNPFALYTSREGRANGGGSL